MYGTYTTPLTNDNMFRGNITVWQQLNKEKTRENGDGQL